MLKELFTIKIIILFVAYFFLNLLLQDQVNKKAKEWPAWLRIFSKIVLRFGYVLTALYILLILIAIFIKK
jgi:hypothetical protein